MLTPGAIVAGRFRIERILGEGGMGVVAVAMHLELDQRARPERGRRQAVKDAYDCQMLHIRIK